MAFLSALHVKLPHHRCELAPISVVFLFMYFADYLPRCTFSVKSSASQAYSCWAHTNSHALNCRLQTNYSHLLLYSWFVARRLHPTNDSRSLGPFSYHPWVKGNWIINFHLFMGDGYYRKQTFIPCISQFHFKAHFKIVCVRRIYGRAKIDGRIKCARTAG